MLRHPKKQTKRSVALLLLATTVFGAVAGIISCVNPAGGSGDPSTGSGGLAATSVALSSPTPGTYATENGTLAVSFNVKNEQSTAVTASDYSVTFYIASSSSFSATSDLSLTPETAPSLPSIASGTSETVDATLKMPDGSDATPYLNQCNYIYATLSATGTVTISNSTTSAADSLVILLSPTSLPTTYNNVTVEVYSPDGGTYPTRPLFAIYDSTNTVNEGNDWTSSTYGAVSGLSLSSGTYYIAVLMAQTGPYALEVHSGNTARQVFATAITSGPDPDNSNDGPPNVTINDLHASSATNGLNTAGAKLLTVGTAVNWWGFLGETDWFKFTLP